jgi:hypothetical protein
MVRCESPSNCYCPLVGHHSQHQHLAASISSCSGARGGAYGPTPSPDVSRNASFVHQPYSVLPSPGGHPTSPEVIATAPTTPSSSQRRVHDPYGASVTRVSPTLFVQDRILSADEETPSASQSPSRPPRMAPRTDTEVFMDSDDGVARFATDAEANDGGEQATAKVEPPAPLRTTTLSSAPVSLHPSPSLPSCQPSLFSQMPPGYDDEEMDLLLLPVATTSNHFRLQQQQQQSQSFFFPGAQHFGYSGPAGKHEQKQRSNTMLIPQDGRPESSCISPNDGLHLTMQKQNSGGNFTGRSGELASSSEQHTPQHLSSVRPPSAGKMSPSSLWPPLTPEEELHLKTLW